MINLKEKIPKTLIEAIKLVVKSLQPDEIKYIKENASHNCHFTMGMAMRNEWGLWKKNSPIVKDIQKTYNIFGHGDDCSGLILSGVWASVRGECIKEVLEKEVERYKKHWLKAGLDPKNGKEIKHIYHK